jgi:hypothetical protein
MMNLVVSRLLELSQLSRLRNSWSKLRRLFASHGSSDAIIEIASRILSVGTLNFVQLRRYYLFSLPIGQESCGVFARRGSSIDVARVDRDDPLIAKLPRPPDEIAARFEAGSQCFIAAKNKAVLGFVWIHRGPYKDPETGATVMLSPPESSVWDFDMYVLPAYRGGLVFPRLWNRVISDLRECGVRHSACMIWASADESIRSHLRLGAYPIGSAVQIKIWRNVVHFSKHCPGHVYDVTKPNYDYARFRER